MLAASIPDPGRDAPRSAGGARAGTPLGGRGGLRGVFLRALGGMHPGGGLALTGCFRAVITRTRTQYPPGHGPLGTGNQPPFLSCTQRAQVRMASDCGVGDFGVCWPIAARPSGTPQLQAGAEMRGLGSLKGTRQIASRGQQCGHSGPGAERIRTGADCGATPLIIIVDPFLNYYCRSLFKADQFSNTRRTICVR